MKIIKGLVIASAFFVNLAFATTATITIDNQTGQSLIKLMEESSGLQGALPQVVNNGEQGSYPFTPSQKRSSAIGVAYGIGSTAGTIDCIFIAGFEKGRAAEYRASSLDGNSDQYECRAEQTAFGAIKFTAVKLG